MCVFFSFYFEQIRERIYTKIYSGTKDKQKFAIR